MLGLNVIYTLKPGKRQAFLDALAKTGVQAAIRQEEGCFQYDFFLPVDGEDRLVLMEKWASREAQQIHLTQPHMAEFRRVKDQFVDAAKLEIYQLED